MTTLIFILMTFIQQNPNQRVLDIYCKDKSDKLYIAQSKVLASDPKGLKIRDIKVNEHFGNTAFKINLTGKDGGVKLTSKSVLTLKKLYDTIDAMPMRKSEMKRQP